MSGLFPTTGPAHGAEPPRAAQGTSLEQLQAWPLPGQWTFDARNLATSPLGPQIPLLSPSHCFTPEEESPRETGEAHFLLGQLPTTAWHRGYGGMVISLPSSLWVMSAEPQPTLNCLCQ